jgi:hypothetical protein
MEVDPHSKRQMSTITIITTTIIQCRPERGGHCDRRSLMAGPEPSGTKARHFPNEGVLAVKGNQERVIVQGVHMILNAAAGGLWNGRPAGNRLSLSAET